MFARLYQNTVIEKPRTILTLLILCLLFFGYYTKDFRLDASSDTLLIENDPDLKYLREVTDRYGAKEFLVLTFTPKESLISDSSINNLLNLNDLSMGMSSDYLEALNFKATFVRIGSLIFGERI